MVEGRVPEARGTWSVREGRDLLKRWEQHPFFDGTWTRVFSVPGLRWTWAQDEQGRWFHHRVIDKEEQLAEHKDDAAIRTFATGATRTAADNKLRFDGFLSPLSLVRYAEYMHEKREMPDGSRRDPDNWKKGITEQSYYESLLRHAVDLMLHNDGYPELAEEPDIESVVCAIMFNAHGLLHEKVKARLAKAKPDPFERLRAHAYVEAELARKKGAL